MNNRKIVEFGDDCEISIPTTPIDCSRLGYFDDLEYECWHLVEKYCEQFGIHVESGDISFYVAKDIQDLILKHFESCGVKFKYTE